MEVACWAQEQVASPRKRRQSKERGLSMTKPLGLVKEEKQAHIPRGSGQGSEKKTRSMK